MNILTSGLPSLIRFATKTPMRQYGFTFGVAGFALGYGTKSANMDFKDVLIGAGILGMVVSGMEDSRNGNTDDNVAVTTHRVVVK